MALARRSGARFTGSIWPGFVDALTALLLILMFVLSIFMIVQFSLRERITGQDQKLQQLDEELTASQGQVSSLTTQLAELSNALGLQRERSEALEGEVGSLRSTLQAEQDETSRLTAALAAMTAARQASEAEVSSLRETLSAEQGETARLAAALAAMTEARELSDAELARVSGELQTSLSEAEALNLALATARSEISEQEEAARLAAAKREALEALVADLEVQRDDREAEIVALNTQQAETLALLQALEQRQAEAEAQITDLDTERAAQLALIETLKAAQATDQETLERLRAENAEALKSLEQLTAEQALALAAVAELELERNRLSEERDRLTAAEASSAQAIDALQIDLEAALARAASLGEELSEAEKARLAEIAAAEELRRKLENSQAELNATALALEEVRAEAEQTLTLLAAAEAARLELSQQALANTDTIDREQALRTVAEQALARAEAQTLDEQRKVAALNVQIQELNEQLGGLQTLLDAARERDELAQVQIAELGSQLNQALAQRVSELSRSRSECFGRMREVLGRREGVRVVGDRFVFQSEVLFGSASADLDPSGLGELAKLADVIRDVASDAPEELNWVLRIDGHTDKVPLTGSGRYRDNWELSQARALSVVRYLTDVEGIPPKRLAATGFGEWQPIDPGEGAEALARNRRIEFKFTER